jgi:hypothetical protein
MALTPLLVVGQLSGINLVDAWWNFALGHLMLEQHQLVTSDPFSFTPAVGGVINQQWLAQLAWALVYDRTGAVGVFVLRAATIALTGVALWSIGRMLGASRRSLVAASLLVSVQFAEFFQIRAQIFAFALAALVLWCLQRGGRVAWFVLPLTVLWANVHGSFPLACAFAVAFAVGSATQPVARARSRSYAMIALAAGISTLVNPYGPQVWRYAVELSSNEALRSSLNEWGPTTLQNLSGKVFFLSIAGGSALLSWRRPHLPVTWLLLTAALAIFALTAIRNIPWFGLISLPVWAVLFTASFTSFRDSVTNARTLRLMVLAILAALAMASTRIVPQQLQTSSGAPPSDQEVTLGDLSSYLQRHPGGLVFNEANWGAYLEAHLSPEQQVFIDTRYEVHPVVVWDDYRAVVSGRFDWESILDKYDIQRVAINPDSSPNLIRALQVSGSWTESWRSDHGTSHSVVWTRNSIGA